MQRNNFENDMKKISYLFLTVCFIVLGFTSCKREYICVDPCNCRPNEVINVNVYRADWHYSDLGYKEGNPYANNYFYCTVDVPEITSAVLKGGNVQIYTVMNDGMQHVLPYVRHYEEYNATDDVWNYFTETVDAFFGLGWVEFQLTSSDFYYEDHVEYEPNAMSFRVVISH